MERSSIDRAAAEVRSDGCVLLKSVFDPSEVAEMIGSLMDALATIHLAVRQRGEHVYAARNLLSLWPQARTVWHRPPLTDLLEAVLGSDYGLVRGLFFDKPPDQTWALPWHKDLLIAVAQGSPLSRRYSRPRDRAGVPHSEPPLEVLEQMLTLRIHLDPVTETNGPLEVLPRSHTTGKQLQIRGFESRRILGGAGDVFAMRPLLVHSSGRSLPGSTSHRRIVHLEFCGLRHLPDGAKWHTFLDRGSSEADSL